MFKGSTEIAGGEAIMFELVLVGYSMKLQLHCELCTSTKKLLWIQLYIFVFRLCIH